MINRILKYGIYFVILVLLQVLLCDNIQFSGYINPFVYLFFILIMPVDMSSWLLLIAAFLMGLVIDVFSGTLGLHAFATVFAAFVRPGVLRLIAPRDGYDPLRDLSVSSYGAKWYLIYSSIIVFIHHLVLFYLEVFRFDDFFNTLFRVILSSVFTVIFVLLCDLVRKNQ